MRGRFGQRQDLFLPLSAAPVRRAVAELVHNLRPLLEAACGPEAALHEISCIYAQVRATVGGGGTRAGRWHAGAGLQDSGRW